MTIMYLKVHTLALFKVLVSIVEFFCDLYDILFVHTIF